MYIESKISNDVYDNYNNLFILYNDKDVYENELPELGRILNYFIDNYSKFNNDEKLLSKNVVIIANAILSNINNEYGIIKTRKSICKSLVSNLNKKQN